MKITALVENFSDKEGIGAEHGLSLYVETNGRRLLFDMGQTDLFAKNAQSLGVDLSEVDTAVLSHGHYDHGGGLKTFLEINSKASVYLSRHAFEPHYNGTEKYIGLDLSLKDSGRLIYTTDVTHINNDMTLFSCNSMKKSCDMGHGGLMLKENDSFTPDDFRHEHYLMIREEGKHVLLSGCSHKGIVNITEWMQPDFVVGGFHMSKITDEAKLKEYAELLDSFDTCFYTCHCTGMEQYEFMKEYMSDLCYLRSGETIEI